MFGIAKNRALTATLSYSFREMSLIDLRILKILIVLKLSEKGPIDMIEKIIIVKSRMFHAYLR
jgi:hypothetical protein